MAYRTGIEDFQGLSPKEANFVIEYCIEFDARAAAVRSGYHPNTGASLLAKQPVLDAIDRVLLSRKRTGDVKSEDILIMAREHRDLALQDKQYGAANKALDIMARHNFVNAYAPEKVEVTTEKAILDRLLRGRQRVLETNQSDDTDEVSFF